MESMKKWTWKWRNDGQNERFYLIIYCLKHNSYRKGRERERNKCVKNYTAHSSRTILRCHRHQGSSSDSPENLALSVTPERGSDLFIRISNLSEAALKTSHELNHLSQLASLLKCGILSPCELDRLLAPEYKSIFSLHPAVGDVCHVQQVHENPTAAEFEGWGWGRGEVCEKVFIPLSPFSFFISFLLPSFFLYLFFPSFSFPNFSFISYWKVVMRIYFNI